MEAQPKRAERLGHLLTRQPVFHEAQKGTRKEQRATPGGQHPAFWPREKLTASWTRGNPGAELRACADNGSGRRALEARSRGDLRLVCSPASAYTQLGSVAPKGSEGAGRRDHTPS